MKKLVKESLNETYVQDGIEWEIQDLLESDPDERMEVYIAVGVDKNGKEYQGTAYYFGDQLDEIKDIEEI